MLVETELLFRSRSSAFTNSIDDKYSSRTNMAKCLLGIATIISRIAAKLCLLSDTTI